MLGDPDRVDTLWCICCPRIICSAGWYGVIESWSLRLHHTSYVISVTMLFRIIIFYFVICQSLFPTSLYIVCNIGNIAIPYHHIWFCNLSVFISDFIIHCSFYILLCCLFILVETLSYSFQLVCLCLSQPSLIACKSIGFAYWSWKLQLSITARHLAERVTRGRKALLILSTPKGSPSNSYISAHWKWGQIGVPWSSTYDICLLYIRPLYVLL